MTLRPAESMGYASTTSIRTVIGRFRDKNLPQPLTVESIQRVGVTASLAPRTIQTLKLLGLIDDDGTVTEQFERLQRAVTSDFKPELISILRAAYAPVFEVIEPSTASYEDVQDAFRTFKPEGQRDRMVALFLGLLEYAEYADTLPITGRSTGTGRTATSSRSTGTSTKKDKPSDRSSNVKREAPPTPPPNPRIESGERFEATFGSAGKVVAHVDVRWVDLPHDTIMALHKALRDIKELGDAFSASQ